MNRLLRRGLIAAAAVGVAAAPAAVFASQAGATPPPPIVIHTTSVQTSDVHLGPNVQVLRYAEYQPKVTAPGFKEVATVLEVCVNVPHVNPPTPTTVLEVCTWKATSVPGTHPATTISGNAVVNGEGQIGRILSGTGLDAGAHGGPGSFRAVNLAPKVSSDTLVFTL